MIDKLRKQKFLEKLSGRVPAQEIPPEDFSAGEPLQMDEMQIEGQLSTPPQQTVTVDTNQAIPGGPVSSIDRVQQSKDNAYSDMWVGAAPALLSLLSGNHNRMVQGFDKSNKYVSKLADQDMKNKKDLKITNQNGKPIYTPSVEAADMQAWVAPTKMGLGSGAAGSSQMAQVYDPKTDQYFSVKHNTRTGEITGLDGSKIELRPDMVVKPVAPKVYNKEDVQGTKTYGEKNPYRPAPKSFDQTEGLGKYYGVGTKGQAENIEKGQGEAQKEFQQNSMALIDAKQSVNDMKTSQDPRIIAAAIYKGARAVEPKGVFTDQDFISITGEDYRSWYKRINDTIATKGLGEIVAYRDSFLPLMQRIQKRIEEKQNSIGQRYAPPTEKAQKGLENVVPIKAGKKANQAEYFQLEKAAAKRWGKGSEKYNKFLSKQKEELGL